MSKIITLGGKRFYPSVEGKWLPSVTTIIDGCFPKSKYLLDWQIEKGKEESERIKNEAADEGTVVHELAERLINGETIATEFLSDKQAICISRFAEWVEEHQPEFIATEKRVGNSSLGYAGTIDLICRIQGVPFVVDLKTSAAIHQSHSLQIVAYREAEGNPEARCAILHLNNNKTKKGWTFKVLTKEEEVKSWKLFDLARRMFVELYPDAKPKQIEIPDIIKLNNNNEISK